MRINTLLKEKLLNSEEIISFSEVENPIKELLEESEKSLLHRKCDCFGNRPPEVTNKNEKECADDFRYKSYMKDMDFFENKEDFMFFYESTAKRKNRKILMAIDEKMKEYYNVDMSKMDDCYKCRMEFEIIELFRNYVKYEEDTFCKRKMFKSFLEHKIYECNSERVALENVRQALGSEQGGSLSEQIWFVLDNGAESDTKEDTQHNMNMLKSVISRECMKKEQEVRTLEELLRQAGTEEIYTEEYRKAARYEEWQMSNALDDFESEYPCEDLPEPENVDRTNLSMLKESYESLFLEFFRSAEGYGDVYKRSMAYFYSCPSVNNLFASVRCPKKCSDAEVFQH